MNETIIKGFNQQSLEETDLKDRRVIDTSVSEWLKTTKDVALRIAGAEGFATETVKFPCESTYFEKVRTFFAGQTSDDQQITSR